MLDTVATYVATGFNQVATARAIHVHLNTLKYRIKRIKELTGFDFGNQRELFFLQLSLELRTR